WVYVPERRFVFHRYAWLSNYGDDYSPGHSGLIAEITLPPNAESDLEKLEHKTVEGLVELGVIKDECVELVRSWYHKYAYPIYTLTHSQDVQTVNQFSSGLNIRNFGRWGQWQYWNTDKIFEASNTLL
ncbi:MAG: protoporphyrinogen/coproporphyrinogen oxidase, partial [Infirmifilum sp.]